ncbi:hypothetical protein ES702_00715 [subsurface metagenome]
MNNITRFQFTISCDTQEQVNLFKDVLEKTINESSQRINKEQAMTKVFMFYLKNEKSTKRTTELIRRNKYLKRKKWEEKRIKEIHQQEYQKIYSRIKHILNDICRQEKEELKSKITELINNNVDIRVEHERMKDELLNKFNEIMEPIKL